MSLIKRANEFFEEEGGIQEFGSKERAKKKILISGGIHGQETGGIEIVLDIRDAILRAELELDVDVLLTLGNRKAINENSRSSTGGYNLNRLFNLGNTDHVARDTYEFERAKEIEDAAASFVPSHVFDLHETLRQSPPMSLKTIRDLMEIQDLQRLVRMGIPNLVLRTFDGKNNGKLRTFEESMAVNYGGDTQTLELGQIGASEMTREAVKRELIRLITGGRITSVEDESKVRVWNAVESPIKSSEGFKFTQPGLVNFTQLTTSPSGYAIDGDTIFTAAPNSSIIFPNEKVEIGERAGVIVMPFER